MSSARRQTTERAAPADPLRTGEALIRGCIERSASRLELWTAFVNEIGAETVAEVGVFRGRFAGRLLDSCPTISRYYMVDPWRHLDIWNKPANRADDVFERHYGVALEKTREHEAKRVVLRGRTVEVIDQVPDGSLDFAYLDGDHTLRGITIDLLRWHEKVRDGGWIGGDDFRRSIWQHGRDYEPTLVFPFAVYFAEAVGTRVYGLPHAQFLLEKGAGGFEFIDLTGKYERVSLLGQLTEPEKRPEPQEVQPRRAGPSLASSFRRLVRRRMARRGTNGEGTAGPQSS